MKGASGRAPNGTIEIRLSLPPDWPKADAVAVFAKAGASATFDQAELGDIVGMVAGELMENAIKYGDWSQPSHLTFSLVSADDRLEIEVSCPCDPTSNHYARLVSSLERITKADARDSYLARLVQLSKDRKERGGLGLLRLAHEANCRLSASLTDERLHVRACMDLPR
jgi:hypothetical protein